MLYNGFAGPLRLKRKLSRLLGGYLVSLHGLALYALCQPLAMPTGVHVILLIGWLASFMYHIRYFWLLRDNEAQAWVWQAGGCWLRGSDSPVFSLVINRSLQTPWFVILALSAEGQKPENLLVLRDQVDENSFRRLRVRLKFFSQDDTTARRDGPV